MVKEKSLIEGIKSFKEKLKEDFPVDAMILFGSAASGKMHKDSDIDLIIVSRKFEGLNFFKRGARMYNYWDLRQPVDFLCYTPKEFNRLKNQTSIVREALNNGIYIN